MHPIIWEEVVKTFNNYKICATSAPKEHKEATRYPIVLKILISPTGTHRKLQRANVRTLAKIEWVLLIIVV